MADQMNSATVLVEKVLSDPKALQGLKDDPAATLRKAEAEVTSQFPLPNSRIVDLIWLVIVVAFALVLVYSVWVLGSGVTHELKEKVAYATKSDTMLTVVTTVVGFLAGLLAPSPVGKKSS